MNVHPTTGRGAPRLLAALALAAALSPARAQNVPTQIHFQGRLTDASNNPLSGPQSFVFGVYDAASGGSLLWTETQPALTVVNGVFAAQLGSVSPLPSSVFAGATAYLQVTVNGSAMSPREQLLAVPYAHQAQLLGGRSYAAFVSTDATTQNIAGAKIFASSVAASAFFGDGSHLTGIAAGSFVPTAGGAMTGALTMLAGSTITVTGAGFSVGGSTLAVANGRVGVGTANPQATLEVLGPLGADLGIDASGSVITVKSGNSPLFRLKP